MSDVHPSLTPGSPVPQAAHERDLLLRRVPELPFMSQFRSLRFARDTVLAGAEANHVQRIDELADAAYLDRVRRALSEAARSAEAEQNGGLRFLATTLEHFLGFVPPSRHPLVVALYFASSSDAAPTPEHLEDIARRMDEYEERLGPLDVGDPHGPSR